MSQKLTCTTPTRFVGKSPILYLAVLFVLVGMAAVACGVESGDRRASRSTVTTVFHRTPVTAFEPLRVDLTKTEEDGCSADPADITLLSSERVRLAIQLPLEGISQGQSLSIVTEGETKEVIYSIPDAYSSSSCRSTSLATGCGTSWIRDCVSFNAPRGGFSLRKWTQEIEIVAPPVMVDIGRSKFL